MKNLSSMVKEFKKTAMESNTLSQRMQTLYEDMGIILNRYYDISEALDSVDPEDVEAGAFISIDSKNLIQQYQNKTEGTINISLNKAFSYFIKLKLELGSRIRCTTYSINQR